MNHDQARDLIHPYVDDELDIISAREFEKHLIQCAECRGLEQSVRALSSALQQTGAAYRAPAGLRKGVRRALRQEAHGSNASFWLPIAVAACAVMIVALFFVRGPVSARHDIADELVADHVRSLLATHLVDIPSSNQHTVKPWFDGKVDFAPDVRDLAAEGFPLVGGRLDYLDNRTVVALVYDRHKHPINLFVVPGNGEGDSSPATSKRRGYNLLHWRQGGLDYWAVSDLNALELQQFGQHFTR
jgi:anti-sigma factor RsiW